MRQLDGRAHDDRRVLVDDHVADEGAVDLDRVHRQAPQVRQRRVAGAVVVDRQRHVELLQPRERVQRADRVLHQRALGQLELDPARACAPGGKRAADAVEQARITQVARRQVHRQRLLQTLLAPGIALAQRGIEHPVGQRRDEAAALRQLDEVVGVDQPEPLVLPAHQRLGAADCA